MSPFTCDARSIAPVVVVAKLQFNAKWAYILCATLFEVGSAIWVAAPLIDALIVRRAICGAGGSGTYVGVMVLLAAITTTDECPGMTTIR